MPRRLIAFVLALVLACSGFSAVARVLLPAFGDEHAVQLIGVGHHHHDGSLGASDSGGPAQHVECDDGVSDAAPMAPAWPAPASPLHYATPAERPDPAMPAPFLEGPLRPPRG
jgi:hypothetical protein